MATVSSWTTDKSQDAYDETFVHARVDEDHLFLRRGDDSELDLGEVFGTPSEQQGSLWGNFGGGPGTTTVKYIRQPITTSESIMVTKIDGVGYPGQVDPTVITIRKQSDDTVLGFTTETSSYVGSDGTKQFSSEPDDPFVIPAGDYWVDFSNTGSGATKLAPSTTSAPSLSGMISASSDFMSGDTFPPTTPTESRRVAVVLIGLPVEVVDIPSDSRPLFDKTLISNTTGFSTTGGDLAADASGLIVDSPENYVSALLTYFSSPVYDYRLMAKIYVVSGQAIDVGVAIRAPDANNFLYARFDRTSGAHNLRVGARVDGASTDLDSIDVSGLVDGGLGTGFYYIMVSGEGRDIIASLWQFDPESRTIPTRPLAIVPSSLPKAISGASSLSKVKKSKAGLFYNGANSGAGGRIVWLKAYA